MNQRSSSLVEAALESWISTASPGARLPPTRELTALHGVSPVTVQVALRSLARRGLIETRPGVGTFASNVRALRPKDLSWQTATLGAAGPAPAAASSALRTVRSDAISLHSGYPDRELLPNASCGRRSPVQAAVRWRSSVPNRQVWPGCAVGSPLRSAPKRPPTSPAPRHVM